MNFSFIKAWGINNEIHSIVYVPVEPLAKQQSRNTAVIMEEDDIFFTLLITFRSKQLLNPNQGYMNIQRPSNDVKKYKSEQKWTKCIKQTETAANKADVFSENCWANWCNLDCLAYS